MVNNNYSDTSEYTPMKHGSSESAAEGRGKNTRAKVLDMLRSAAGGISGEAMATQIGVSRVAVWKAVKGLCEAGYEIAGNPEGYALVRDKTDSIDEWEFGADAPRFRHLESTDSTMNRAFDEALRGAAHGLVVTADRQLTGRGMSGKAWNSAAGGLFFTIVTRPGLAVWDSHRMVMAAQCAAAEAVRSATGVECSLDWPNDLLVGSGKIGGILGEGLFSGTTLSFMNLGVGINTGERPDMPGTGAVNGGRKEILDFFLKNFDRIDPESPGLASRWNSKCPRIGQSIIGKTVGGARVEGAFLGIDEAGRARIREDKEAGGYGERLFSPGSLSIETKGWRR